MYGNNPYQSYPYQSNFSGMSGYAQRGYNSQPQPMAQPIQQNPMQSQPQFAVQPTMPQIQDVRYGTEAEAQAFIVIPNASAYFIDLQKNRMYVKSANNAGVSSMEYFALTAINPDGSPIKPQEPTPQIDLDNFVKKEDLEKLGFITFDEHKKVLDELESIKKYLSGNRFTAKPETTKGGTQ